MTADTQLVRQVQVEKAREEAGLRMTGNFIPELRQLIAAAAATVPGGDVSLHDVPFDPQRWPREAQDVFQAQRLTGPRLSRQDVIASGRGVGGEWRTFLLSFAWGWGSTAYGPARLARILARTDKQGITGVLEDAADMLAGLGPIGAYHRLRRRVPYWGPAFFTKWLYFIDRSAARDGALILDARVARKLTQLTGMPHLVDRHDRVPTWTAYRYGVYLAWVHGVSAELSSRQSLTIPADLIEFALFRRSQPGVSPATRSARRAGLGLGSGT